MARAVDRREPEGYIAALKKQMSFAEAILQGLGYAGTHFLVIEGEDLEKSLWDLAPAAGVKKAATFNLSTEKRTSLDFAFDFLSKDSQSKTQGNQLFPRARPSARSRSTRKPARCARPASAPARKRRCSIRRRRRCCASSSATACSAACARRPARKTQLLLCQDCPWKKKRNKPVTLNEAEPFNCVRCGKPFGTRRMVENMTGKLGAHSMFAGGGALKRLQMCGDCRVIDMASSKDEPSIFDYTGRSERTVTEPALQPEDEARAGIYGLIARLFYAPPDAGRARARCCTSNAFEGSEAPVAVAWRELVDACRNAFPVVLENEHTDLFVGTGKAEVTPYLTHYTIKYATDNPLVELRQQLNRWGMARARRTPTNPKTTSPASAKPCALLLRCNIGIVDGAERCSSSAFSIAGAIAFCDAVTASDKADFYRRVAHFAQRIPRTRARGLRDALNNRA